MGDLLTGAPLEDLAEFTSDPTVRPGPWRRLHEPLGDGIFLDALLAFRGEGLPIVCFLPSALHPDNHNNPSFMRHSWVDSLGGANVMVVSDPLIYVNDSLEGGWLLHPEVDVLGGIVDAVRAVMAGWSVSAERVLLYGSSLGGFMGIQMGPHLPGCRVVAENPQIDFRLFPNERAKRAVEEHLLRTSLDDWHTRHPEQIEADRYLARAGHVPHLRIVTNPADDAFDEILGLARMLPGIGDQSSGNLTIELVREVHGHVPLPRAEALKRVAAEIAVMPDIQAGNILRGRATRGLFCGALPISAVIQFDFPEPLHNFGLHATTVGGAGTPQHAALMSLKLRTIDPDGDLDALMEGTFGLAKSGLAHIGWFNYLSTGSSELRSTMEVVLPQGVECTAVDIVPWGQGAPVTLTGLSLEWVAGA